MATVEYGHITTGPDGVAMLTGTQTKVVEIVLDHLRTAPTPSRFNASFPIFRSGKSTVRWRTDYDHKQDVDEDIRRRRLKVEAIRAEIGDGPLTDKLKVTDRLP